MTASNFNLRNIDPEVMALLKKEAVKQNVSINFLILHILKQKFGIAYPEKKATFHDLDHLAGTWSKKDKEIFDKRIKSFETIDKDLWE